MRVDRRQVRAPQASRAGDARAQALVAQAMRFRGQRYVWGGGHARRTGVQPVDCSGLVGQAARLAGFSFEGRARDMQARARRIGMDALRPGDLVFKGRPARHVGIYVGNGQVLHAPRSGANVGLTSLRGWTSAGRIPGVNAGHETGAPAEAPRPRRRPRMAADSVSLSAAARHRGR